MNMQLYVLTGATPDMTDEELRESVIDGFTRNILPNTRFTHINPTEESPARMHSDQGQQYLTEGFETTTSVIADRLAELHERLRHHGITAATDPESTSATVAQNALNDRELREAAFQIGEDRGIATAVYVNDETGRGVRTRDELDAYLTDSDIADSTGNEYYAVVPIRGHH